MEHAPDGTQRPCSPPSLSYTPGREATAGTAAQDGKNARQKRPLGLRKFRSCKLWQGRKATRAPFCGRSRGPECWPLRLAPTKLLPMSRHLPFGLSWRAVIAGAVVVLVFFTGTLWALN